MSVCDAMQPTAPPGSACQLPFMLQFPMKHEMPKMASAKRRRITSCGRVRRGVLEVFCIPIPLKPRAQDRSKKKDDPKPIQASSHAKGPFARAFAEFDQPSFAHPYRQGRGSQRNSLSRRRTVQGNNHRSRVTIGHRFTLVIFVCFIDLAWGGLV